MNLVERIKNNKSNVVINGVYYLTGPVINDPAEEIYLKTRKMEGRFYDDKIVKDLPDFPQDHTYSEEWRLRKISSPKLINYLTDFHGDKNILDLGCGNGWLSNILSELDNSCVIGMDVNKVELEQAARIFLPKSNLAFVYADIFDRKVSEFKFDFIILSASIQYFQDLKLLLENLLTRLNPDGEIHIIDSPFYTEKDVSAASERTSIYYRNLGVPEMIAFYHHHTLCEILQDFSIEILYNPKELMNWFKKGLSKNYSPFYWIKVKQTTKV